MSIKRLIDGRSRFAHRNELAVIERTALSGGRLRLDDGGALAYGTAVALFNARPAPLKQRRHGQGTVRRDIEKIGLGRPGSYRGVTQRPDIENMNVNWPRRLSS